VRDVDLLLLNGLMFINMNCSAQHRRHLANARDIFIRVNILDP
jgi:hypothetical protein